MNKHYAVALLVIASCLSTLMVGTRSQAAEAISVVDKPVTVPLIKLEYPGNPPNIRMVYIQLQALGNKVVYEPLLFDTGSPGITIECPSVLPIMYCSEKGLKLKKPLELDGITVTTQRIVSHYGTYDEYGNLAFARVTFGSSKLLVSTAERVPILIRYKRVRRSTGEVVGGYLWPKGIFGVSPVGGGANGKLKSPMDFISVGPGLHRGFYLSPFGTNWRICTNERRDCPEVDALHIGIDPQEKPNFRLKKWKRQSPNHNFPTTSMCLEWQGYSKCRPTLYDTGNSTIQVASKPSKRNQMSLPINTAVSLSGQAHEIWKFKTQYQPEVEFVPALDHHIVGIRYFEQNSLLFDLDTKEIGFRIGP